jgi:hypothetical protein
MALAKFSSRVTRIMRPGALKPRALMLIVTLVMSAWTLGCASPVGRYFKNRATDFFDVLTIEGSVGPGFHGLVQATDFLGTGIGYSMQYGFWVHGRHPGFGYRKSTGIVVMSRSRPEYDLGTDPHVESWMDSWHSVVGVNATPSTENTDPVLRAWDKKKTSEQGSLLFFFPLNASHLGSHDYHFGLRSFDLTASASACVGLYVSVSPGEFADFMLGWFGVDVGHDDEHGKAKQDDRKDESKPAPTPAP